MAKLVTRDLVIDGFKSNDVDFPACLQRSPKRQEFIEVRAMTSGPVAVTACVVPSAGVCGYATLTVR